MAISGCAGPAAEVIELSLSVFVPGVSWVPGIESRSGAASRARMEEKRRHESKMAGRCTSPALPGHRRDGCVSLTGMGGRCAPIIGEGRKACDRSRCRAGYRATDPGRRGDRMIGVEEKLEAHRSGVLHRAFSVLVRDSAGAGSCNGAAWPSTIRRALDHAACGHPRPREGRRRRPSRRLFEELRFLLPAPLRHQAALPLGPRPRHDRARARLRLRRPP
jgi:hypothetical protein